MSRYIDAGALLAELEEEIDFKTTMYTEEQNMYFSMGLKCAVRDVKSQPTADVVEVRHGEYHYRRFTDGVYYQKQCSICREWTYEYDENYCPHCGAKMDGERREG